MLISLALLQHPLASVRTGGANHVILGYSNPWKVAHSCLGKGLVEKLGHSSATLQLLLVYRELETGWTRLKKVAALIMYV